MKIRISPCYTGIFGGNSDLFDGKKPLSPYKKTKLSLGSVKKLSNECHERGQTKPLPWLRVSNLVFLTQRQIGICYEIDKNLISLR